MKLNLHRLIVIFKVRYLESRQEMHGNFTVNIDRYLGNNSSLTVFRSEIDSLHGQYSGQLESWRRRCEEAERKLGEANVQVLYLQENT